MNLDLCCYRHYFFKVLRLFTSTQLEVAVAGEPEFDIAFWKEHTEYKGYRPDDDTVTFFWKVHITTVTDVALLLPFLLRANDRLPAHRTYPGRTN